MSTTDESAIEREEPYWVVVAELESEEYVSATIDAPTEADARTEGGRRIAAGEDTGEFDIVRTSGPFPASPGEAAPEVRPHGCGGCGLHCWPGDRPPCPRSTWFRRSVESEDSIGWECIQCGTVTWIPIDRGGDSDA